MENTFNAIMTASLVSFWIIFIGKCQGDIFLSVVSQSYTPTICILDGENMATVSCEITTATSTAVVWKRDSVSLTTCDNTANDCIPVAVGKYSFTSNFTQRLFYFNIATVTLGTDEGIYLCEEGGSDKSITLAVCKVPTTVTFTESGSGTITLTSSSDCVYPPTNVTIEWFYVLVSPPNTESRLGLTPTNASLISDCQHGAKKVTSTIQHTDATENIIEVYFRVKVSHSASAEPVMETYYNRSYFIEENESEDSGNKEIIIGVELVVGVVGGLLILVAGVTVFSLYVLFKDTLLIIPLYEGNGYILKWRPLKRPKTTELECYEIYMKNIEDKWALISEEKTTFSEINSFAYDFKVCAKYREAVQSKKTTDGQVCRLRWNPINSPKECLGYLVMKAARQDPDDIAYCAKPNERDCIIDSAVEEWDVYAEIKEEIGTKMKVKDELSIRPTSEGVGFQLIWQAPQQNYEVLRYQVKRIDDDKWINVRQVSSDIRHFVIDSLAYDWKVCTIFRQEVSTIIPHAGKILHWEKVNTQKQCIHFEVMRQKDEDDWKHFCFKDQNTLNCTIDNSDSKWKVYAYFEETLGEKKKVKDVCIIPRGDNSDYTLTWTLPRGLSDVCSYHILRRRNQEKWEEIYVVPTIQTSGNFRGKEYQWKICAEERSGRRADIGVAEVDNGVPGKPKHLCLKLEKDHSQQGGKTKLSMTWKTPVHSGKSPVQYYQIWLKKHLNAPETENNWKRFKVALPQQTSFIDDDWTEGMDFQIGICAVNKQGYGRMGCKAAAPSKPASIALLRVGKECTLLWEVSKYEGSSDIKTYHISKRPKSENSSWKTAFSVNVGEYLKKRIEDQVDLFYYKCYAENQHTCGQPLDTVRKIVDITALGRPTDLCLDISGSEHRISWNLPDNSFDIEKIYIAISEIDDRELEYMVEQYPLETLIPTNENILKYILNNTNKIPVMEIFVTASTTVYKTANLRAEKHYICSIRTVNQHGSGIPTYFTRKNTAKYIQRCIREGFENIQIHPRWSIPKRYKINV